MDVLVARERGAENHGRGKRGQRPEPERDVPAAVERTRDRLGQPGPQRRAGAERRDVDAHHHSGPRGKARFHDDRHDHVCDRDPGARDDRSEEERRNGRVRPHGNTGDDRNERGEQHALGPEPARQGRRRGREQAEAQERQARQEPGGSRGQAEVGFDLVDHRRHARDSDPQVEPRENDARGEQQAGAACRQIDSSPT